MSPQLRLRVDRFLAEIEIHVKQPEVMAGLTGVLLEIIQIANLEPKMAVEWTFVSSKLIDNAEILTLKRNGKVFCEYARAQVPYESIWHVYYHGFPKFELMSREACIRDAEKLAGQKLKIT